MSTRSMTVLVGTRGEVTYLYRHHDGYPAAAGGDLADALVAGGGASDVAARLLALRDRGPRGPGRPYELVDDSPEERSDLDHVYEVDCRFRAFYVTHYVRGERDPITAPYQQWLHVRRTEADWRGFVEEERANPRARGGRP